MTDSKRGKRLIFVSGAPRSGTTLVQNMLDSHPEICGGPEFLHIRDIVKLRNILHRSIAKEWINLICSYKDVDQAISHLIENLLLPLADKNGCKFFSEKSPQTIVVLPELVNLFSEARFIHVVRDPRAIISSMLQVGKRARQKNINTQQFTRNMHTAIDYVKNCFGNGFSAAKIAPNRVSTVCYEKLIGNPQLETKRICDFLHLEWSPQMIRPGDFKHLGEEAATVKSGEVWYDVATYRSNPTTENIHKWKRTLTSTQQAAITLAFRDYQELYRLGYDFSDDSLPKIKRTLYTSFAKLSCLKNKSLRYSISLMIRTFQKAL